MISLDDLRRALRLTDFDAVSAHRRMSPGVRPLRPPDGVIPRQAGVLALVYPNGDGLHLVLTRRTDNLSGHSGQVSFPGGRRDPTDTSFTVTALRETCEELGLCDPAIEIIGSLSMLYIPPSNFEVYPTVAALPYQPVFQPNPHEVAEVFTLPLDSLLDTAIKQQEDWDFQGMRVAIPFYSVSGHKVWGATAIMLSELEERLRLVVNGHK